MVTDLEKQIQQAQEEGKSALLNPTSFMPQPQEEDLPLTQYQTVMNAPREDSTRPREVFDQLINQTDEESYTRWYEKNNKQHLPGFEIEGRLQLKADTVRRYEDLYKRGEIGYSTFLMESVGYDIAKTELNIDFKNPNWWYLRYQNNDFSDPRQDTQFLEQILLRSEKYLSESQISRVINGPSIFNSYVDELIGEYRSGNTATDDTMLQFFGVEWQNIKAQYSDDVEAALKSLRGHTSMGRLSEDQKRYIHTDGRIYDVVEEGQEGWSGSGIIETGRQSIASLKRNADGSVNSITINNHQLTGNLLVDNIVSGASGFMIDLGKTVSQVAAGLIDLGESAVTGEMRFDRVVDVALAFEGFKSSNPFTAKAYVDLDGFQMDSFRDWMNTAGDITGLFLGMYLTAGLGGGLQKAGESMALGASGAGALLGKGVNFTGKTLSSISNLHNGSMSRGFASPLASRSVFAMTHASKDALRTYTYQRLAGKDEQSAWTSAGSVFLTNTLITMAIGSGSKDDTYRMYRGLAQSAGARTSAAKLANLSFAKSQLPNKLADKVVTTGLDFFDNYLTMSIAGRVEQAGGRAGGQAIIEELQTLFTGNADFSQVITAAAIAGNAWRGVESDYRTGTIDNRSIGGTAKDTVRSMNRIIEDPKTTPEDRSVMQTVKSEYDRILTKPESEGGGILNALEFVHNAIKKPNGESSVSRAFAKLTKEFNKETYLANRKVIQEYQDAHVKRAGGYLYRVMTQGFVRGTASKIKDWSGGREIQNFRQLLNAEAYALREQSRAFSNLTDPLNEIYNVLYGRDIQPGEERDQKPLFDDSKLFNENNFKYNEEKQVYEFQLEGKGILDGDAQWRTMNMILQRLADAGLIKVSEDDKGMTKYEIPSSMNKTLHVAQAIHDMYAGLVRLSQLDENATPADYVKAANDIKNLVVHGKDELDPDKDAMIGVQYLIEAAKLGYVSEAKVVEAVGRMLKEEDLNAAAMRVDDEVGAYAKAHQFMERIGNNTVLLEADLPPAGSQFEKVLFKVLGQKDAKGIQDFVKAYNEEIKKSPQSFASTLEAQFSRGVEEGLEIAIEADNYLNPRQPLSRVFGDDSPSKAIELTVINQIRDELLKENKITLGEWNGRKKNVSLERRVEILNDILKLKVPGMEPYKERIQEALNVMRTHDLLLGTVRSDDGEVEFTTETYQIRPGAVIIDKYNFRPAQLGRVYELMAQYKENFNTLGDKSPENVNQYLRSQGINMNKLETEIALWEEFLRTDQSGQRFLAVDAAFLKKFGYRPREFRNFHVSPVRGVINGNAFQKGFALRNKVKDLTIRIEKVTNEGIPRETFRVAAAMDEVGNELQITSDTIITPGQIGYLFGDILTQGRVDGIGNGFKLQTDVKSATLGGDAFQRFAIAMYGRYAALDMSERAKANAVNKAVADIVQHLRDNPPLDTRIKLDLDPENVNQDMLNVVGKYWNFDKRDDGYYITSLKFDAVENDLRVDAVNIRELLLLDYVETKVQRGDLLKKKMVREVIAAEGSLYEKLSTLENDYAVFIIKDAFVNRTDYVAREFDATPYEMKSNRVGDIIADLESKDILTPTEKSLLTLLKYYLVEDMTLETKLLNDLDLISRSQLQATSIDDLILYLQARQERATELGEISTFNKNFFDEEGNFVVEPRDLRNLDLVYQYDFNDPLFRQTLESVIERLTSEETKRLDTHRVNSEDSWKSLIVEANDKQYIDYEAVTHADARMIEGLRKNLSPEDRKRFDLFIKEFEAMVGRTEGKDDLVFEWRAPVEDVSAPSLKESTHSLVRGRMDGEKLDTFISRAEAQNKANADRLRFNDFAKAFDDSYSAEQKSTTRTLKERVSEDLFNARYRTYFDGKENPEVYEEVRNGARYVFLDNDGNIVYSGYGKEDMFSLMFARPDVLDKAKHVVGADINAKSLFEEIRMNIIDLDNKVDGITLRDRMLQYGNYDIYNYFRQNRPQYLDMLKSDTTRQEYYKEFSKNPNSEKGTLYSKFLDDVSDFVFQRTSSRKNIDNGVARWFSGKPYDGLDASDRRVVREVVDTFINIAYDPTSAEVSSKELTMYNILTNTSEMPDMRVQNSPGERILQQMINGVNISRLSQEDRQFVETKVSNIVKLYTKGIKKETVEIAREYIQKQLASINESEKRESKQIPVPQELKELDPKKLERLVFGITLEQQADMGVNANAFKFLLNDNTDEKIGYTFEQAKRDAQRGLTFKFDDRYELGSKRVFVMDIESLVDNIKNITRSYPLSLSVREIDIETGESKSSEVYRFKNTSEETKEFYDKTISYMKSRGDDTKGLENDYKSSIELTADQRAQLREVLVRLNEDPNVIVLTHNGASFDYTKILATMYPDLADIFRPGNKTFLDSIEVLRDLTLKTTTNNFRSSLEEYRNNALAVNKDSEVLNRTADHSAEGDTRLLAEVISTFYREAKEGVKAEHGIMFKEMNEVYKSITGKELDMSAIADEKITQGSGRNRADFFGVDKTFDKVTELQRIKAYKDFVTNRSTPYMLYREYVDNFMKNISLTEKAQRLIENVGVSESARFASFLSSKERFGLIESFSKFLGAGGTEKDSTLLERLIDPETYSLDNFKTIFGAKEGEELFNEYKNYRFDNETAKRSLVEQIFPDSKTRQSILDKYAMAPVNQNDYLMKGLFDLLDSSLNFVDSEFKEPLFALMAHSYKDHFVVDKDLAQRINDYKVEELDLFRFIHNNEKFNQNVDLTFKNIFDQVGGSSSAFEGSYGNARYLEHNTPYRIQTADGFEERVVKANEIGITKDTAINLFGADYEAENLYGWILRYPTVNKQSFVPMKYAVIDDETIRGNQYLMDDNLMLSIEGDFDGDKFMLFGNKNKASNEAIKFLNEKLLSPYVKLREAIESRTALETAPRESITRYFLEASKHYDEYKKDGSYLDRLFKESTIDQKQIADFKKFIIEADANKTPAQVQKFLRQRSLINDQQKGMNLKDVSNARIAEYIKSSEDFYADKDNLLARGDVREVAFTDRTVELLTNRGFTEEQVKEFVMDLNNEMLRDLKNPEANLEFGRLIDAVDADGEARKLVDQAVKVAKKFDEINDTLLKVDKDYFFTDNDELRSDLFKQTIFSLLDFEQLGLDAVEKVENYTELLNRNELVMLVLDDTDASEYIPTDTYIPTTRFVKDLVVNKATSVVRPKGFDVSIELRQLKNLPDARIGDSLNDRNIRKQLIDVLIGKMVSGSKKYFGNETKYNNEWFSSLRKEMIAAVESTNDAELRESLLAIRTRLVDPDPYFAENILKEILMLNGIKRKQVSKDTVVKDLLKDKKFNEWSRKTYDSMDVVTEDTVDGLRIFNTEFDFVDVFEEFNKYISNYQSKDIVNVYRGMPIFAKGKEVITSPITGQVKINEDGAVFIEQSPVTSEALKLSAQGLSGFKAMPFGKMFDSNEFDFIIGGQNVKSSKMDLSRLKQTQNLGRTEIVVNGKTYRGTLVKSDVFAIENINAWKPSEERNGSVIVDDSKPGTVDVTSFLANVNTALGRVLFNKDQLSQLASLKDKYTPAPVVEQDMSPVMANLKYQLILSALNEQQRTELTGYKPEEKMLYNSKIINNIDSYLLSADDYLKKENITPKQIAEKLSKRLPENMGANQRNKTIAMIEGILSYDDYLSEHVMYINGQEISFTKAGSAKAEQEFITYGGKQYDYEYGDSLIRAPHLKEMPYSKFMEQIGLYYDKYADRDAFSMGYHKPSERLSLGVGNSFRNVNGDFAEKFDGTMMMNQIIGSAKAGGVTKGLDVQYTIPNRTIKPSEQTSRSTLPVSERASETLKEIRSSAYRPGIDDPIIRQQLMIGKALDTVKDMEYFENRNNVERFKAGLSNRKVSMASSDDLLYSSLNFAKDPATKDLKFTGVVNKGEINYNLNDPNVIRVPGSADFFDISRSGQRVEDLSNIEMLDPKTIVKVSFEPLLEQRESIKQSFDTNLKEYNDRLSKIDSNIARNSFEAEMVDPTTGEVRMAEPVTHVNKGVFNILKNNFKAEYAPRQNNLDAVFNKSFWRSMGLKYDSPLAFQVHSALQRSATLASYTRQIYTNRLVNIMDSVRKAGPLAKEQFSQYYLFSRLLTEIKEKQAINKLTGAEEVLTTVVQKDLLNRLGASDLNDAIKKMETFVREYGSIGQNGKIVDELWALQKDLLDDYRVANNKTNSPIENSYALLFPLIKDMTDANDNGKKNFAAKKRIMVRPSKYDNQPDMLKLHDPTDIITGIYRLASEVSEMNAKLELSKDLVQTGVLRNEEVMTIAEKFLTTAFDEITSKEGAYKSNKLMNKLLGNLYTNLNPEDAEMFRNEYERRQGSTSKHNVKNLFFAGRLVIDELSFELNERFGPDVNTVDDVRALMRSTTDPNELIFLERAENTLAQIQETYGVLIAGTKAAEDFRENIVKEAGPRFNIVDKFARKLDGEYVKPLSESNVEFIKASIENGNPETFLSKALMGELYFGNKDLTNILDKTLYRKPKEGPIRDILRKTQNTFNRFQFGNPFRLIRRMENFTFTDTWMVAMANIKAPLYLPEARRLLSQSYNSERSQVDPKVQDFQRHSGTMINTTAYVDYFSRQVDVLKNPFAARNFVQKTFDVSLEGLTFQHQLARFALYLATRDEIEKTGNIQSYGAAYRFKDFIDGIDDPGERAYRLMQMNIASFGDFPIMIRDIAPWLMLTSFTLGQARWAADWGMSMKEAAMDVFKAMREGAKEGTKQDLSAAYRTLAYPSVVTGLGVSVGWAIIEWLSSLFDVDEETKQEWLDEGRYLEVIGTLVNGSPTFTASKASPVDIVYDDWVKTGIKGYQKDKSIIDAGMAYVNKHLISRTNPAIKLPIESALGKNYFGEFSTDDRYSTNFMENMIRKSAGVLVGTGTVNAYIDNMRFNEYSNNEVGFANAIFNGMKDSIASEFGNTRSYKKDIKDFYYARSLIHGQLNEENYYNRISETYNSSDTGSDILYTNDYDKDKADELARVFRTMMTRNEPASTLYAIVQEEMRKGTAIPTIHGALNRVSVLREMKKLEDPDAFVASLSEQDQIRLRNAVQYEQKMFPGIADINLYDMVGGSKRSNYLNIYRPYYREKYQPYRRYRPNRNFRSGVNFYNNMNTYHPYYQPGSIYERWAKPEEGIKDTRVQRTNRR